VPIIARVASFTWGRNGEGGIQAGEREGRAGRKISSRAGIPPSLSLFSFSLIFCQKKIYGYSICYKKDSYRLKMA